MATIAVAGKGGSGKTTIAGTLARVIARGGREVWAIDADSTPNLGITLGLARGASEQLAPMPRSILAEAGVGPDGRKIMQLSMDPAAVVREYATDTPDSVKLLMMGRVDHAGAG